MFLGQPRCPMSCPQEHPHLLHFFALLGPGGSRGLALLQRIMLQLYISCAFQHGTWLGNDGFLFVCNPTLNFL